MADQEEPAERDPAGSAFSETEEQIAPDYAATSPALAPRALGSASPVAPNPLKSPAPGTFAGRYQIGERIGAGAMGSVFRSRDPKLDRDIAIKILHTGTAETAAGSAFAARLMREAQAMARVSHENLAVVHDVGQSDEGVFVAMEFIDGQSLTQWLKESKRSFQERLYAPPHDQ